MTIQALLTATAPKSKCLSSLLSVLIATSILVFINVIMLAYFCAIYTCCKLAKM